MFASSICGKHMNSIPALSSKQDYIPQVVVVVVVVVVYFPWPHPLDVQL